VKRRPCCALVRGRLPETSRRSVRGASSGARSARGARLAPCANAHPPSCASRPSWRGARDPEAEGIGEILTALPGPTFARARGSVHVAGRVLAGRRSAPTRA
jgi:hypothetical protein